jgi:membrane-bound lytic murein transglycosylase D
MSRENFFLLSIITMIFFFTQNSFIGDAYGQTITGKETSRKAITAEKLSGTDNVQKTIDSIVIEDPSIQKKNDQSIKDASSELKNVSPSNGMLKEQEREEKGRDVMEEALELLNESRDYWVKGDLENALEMLDQAYALLLDTNGEPDIARQKDDMRLLISKQLLTIYSSKHTTTNGQRSEIRISSTRM